MSARSKGKKGPPAAPAFNPAFLAAFNDGMALHQAGKLEEAAASFKRACTLNPNHALPYNNLGSTLKALGRPAEAADAFRKAIALDPDMAMAYSNLGSALTELRQYDEAKKSIETALRIQPEYPEASNNLATCLLETGFVNEALASVRRAIALKPDYAEAYSNLGAALSAALETQDAITAFEQALALQPNLPMTHKNLGLACLRVDQFEKGWREYEWRWIADGLPPRDYPRPLWKGEPVAGKTVLLYSEQGLGDAIHFARFVPVLAQQGARVIFEVHAPLMPLMRELDGVAQVIPLGGTLPEFDTYHAIMTVPLILGINRRNIPTPTPYIIPDPARVAKWRERLGTHGFKIGIVWEGKGETPSQRSRSTTLDSFAGIAALEGVRMISLQKGAEVSAAPFMLETLGEDFDTGPGAFMDSAAVMKCLDLIVTVDTSLAHLAGALGVPTWIALKFAPDWRWEEQGEFTPWYTTARLFRQPQLAAWEPAFAAITDALRNHLKNSAPLLVDGPKPEPLNFAGPRSEPVTPMAAPAPRDMRRIEAFLATAAAQPALSSPADLHVSVTASTIDNLQRDGFFKAGDRLLDVSAANGQAIELFRGLGLRASGIGSTQEAAACRTKGLDVVEMDQNFLSFGDGTFDVLWCRHTLERSVIPLFTLLEYRRVTKPGGLIYVEVAAPDTSVHHERDPANYSVLPMSSWTQLIARSGCAVERSWAINFTVAAGADTFWSFLLRRT